MPATAIVRAITTDTRPRAEVERGSELPVRVDPEDPAQIAIDWDNAPRQPTPGEIRPA